MHRLGMTIAIFVFWASASAALASTLPDNPANQIHPSATSTKIWNELRPALETFNTGGSREKFLATCKRLLDDYPDSDYTAMLTSLITPIEREAASPTPEWLAKDRYQRTQEEQIRALIYQLRDVGARTSSGEGTDAPPIEEIVKIGPPAIPFLIDALSDDTPTRIVTFQREFYPYWFVLRREDLALSCLERITSVRFYNGGATFLHFYIDSPVRRQSVLDDVHTWWAESQGKPQAQMIRNQLALMPRNVTLQSDDRISALAALALIEGPEAVEPELRQQFYQDSGEMNSYIQTVLNVIDPTVTVQAAFARFAADKATQDDYLLLYQYGDRQTYAELTRRMVAAGHLLPQEWSGADEVKQAADLGQNWAIPLVAFALNDDTMSGSRSGTDGEGTFSTADVAIVELSKLTGKDFGYSGFTPEADRLQKIHAARLWWETIGKTATRALVAQDHALAYTRGDLLDSNAAITARIAAITGSDATKRRQTIAMLPEVYSQRVQRALLTALAHEKDPQSRRRMLLLLQPHALIWEIEPLAQIFAHDQDTTCRLLAGDIIATMPTDPYWFVGSRLENREHALEVVRQAAEEKSVPPSVRAVADNILGVGRRAVSYYGWFGDSP